MWTRQKARAGEQQSHFCQGLISSLCSQLSTICPLVTFLVASSGVTIGRSSEKHQSRKCDLAAPEAVSCFVPAPRDFTVTARTSTTAAIQPPKKTFVLLFCFNCVTFSLRTKDSAGLVLRLHSHLLFSIEFSCAKNTM